MNDFTSRNLCTGCGVCEAVCPQKAILLKPDQEGFFYPCIEESLCSHCQQCILKCPVKNSSPANTHSTFFGAHAKDKRIRLMGSSGGIFPLLAISVLQKQGIVFGAALTKDGQVLHKGIDKISDLEQITRTKYVQSNLSGIWEKINISLKEGRVVLFCGTPCQTEALRSYLGKEYENLFLADLICYGVPSPGIWHNYLDFLKKRYHQKPKNFFFRDKRRKDNGHSVTIQFENTESSYSIYEDPFLRSYFKNINLRPSCYHCSYCTVARNSDITLGDFWGLEGINPQFDDGLGNSLLICHTAKGKHLFEHIKGETEWFSCEEADAIQPRLQKPTKPSIARSLYMLLYQCLPFSLWIRLFSSCGPVHKLSSLLLKR